MSWPEERYATRWPQHHERPVGPVALLERVLANLPAMPEAACRDADPAMFDVGRIGDAAQAASALAFCARCPVISQCRDYALRQPRKALVGIWAGGWYLDRANNSQEGSQP